MLSNPSTCRVFSAEILPKLSALKLTLLEAADSVRKLAAASSFGLPQPQPEQARLPTFLSHSPTWLSGFKQPCEAYSSNANFVLMCVMVNLMFEGPCEKFCHSRRGMNVCRYKDKYKRPMNTGLPRPFCALQRPVRRRPWSAEDTRLDHHP